MPLPAITAAPPAPNRWTDSPDAFTTKSIAWVDWQYTLPGQINAYSAALVAVVAGTDFNAASTTSLAIGTGSKTLTAETGKLYQIGQFVTVANSAAPANYMYGQVTAYNSGTGALSVNVTTVGGSGTFEAWSIGIAPLAPAYLALGGGTMLGALITATPAAGQEALIIPHGADPSTPTNGGVWTKTSGLYARIGGVTLLGGIPVGAGSLLGRTSAGTGSAEAIAPGPGIDLSAASIAVEGSIVHALHGGI